MGFGAVMVVAGLVVLATFATLVDSEAVPGPELPLWLALTLAVGALLVVVGFTRFVIGLVAAFVAAVRDAVRHKRA